MPGPNDRLSGGQTVSRGLRRVSSLRRHHRQLSERISVHPRLFGTKSLSQCQTQLRVGRHVHDRMQRDSRAGSGPLRQLMPRRPSELQRQNLPRHLQAQRREAGAELPLELELRLPVLLEQRAHEARPLSTPPLNPSPRRPSGPRRDASEGHRTAPSRAPTRAPHRPQMPASSRHARPRNAAARPAR